MESRSGKNNRGGRDEPGHDAVGVVRRLQQLAAMKTKSHGTAFAHPVAPLMWKSGTCHVLMARVAYVARPAATSRYGDAVTAKKSTLPTLNQISGPAMADKPDMSK